MSDIKKYIIAGGDEEDGEHTRLGCLAMVRYAVAAMVTVLTVTVIALSIHAVLRSEDMGLAVNKGYIVADALWKQTVPTSSPAGGGYTRGYHRPKPPTTGAAAAAAAAEAAKLGRRRRRRGLAAGAAGGQVSYGGALTRPALPKDCFLGCSGGSGDEPTQVTFNEAERTNLRVILIANNPGGRTRIDCNGTRVSLVDVKHPYGQIGNVTLGDFTVPPQTTITLQARLNDTNTSYIWDNYHLANRFSVQVLVTSSVTSYPLGKKGKTVQQAYTCQPVTVGLVDDEAAYAGDHVPCTAGGGH